MSTEKERGERRLKTLGEYIENSNAKFKEMTREEKKVQIAKDVLFQLEIGRLHANSVYLESYELEQEFWRLQQREADEDMKKLLSKIPRCTVCGIGAVFVATVDRLNELKMSGLDSLDDRASMIRYEERMGVFIKPELDFIEECFEMRNEFVSAAPEERMRKIMQKIIETGGVVTRAAFGVTSSYYSALPY